MKKCLLLLFVVLGNLAATLATPTQISSKVPDARNYYYTAIHCWKNCGPGKCRSDHCGPSGYCCKKQYGKCPAQLLPLADTVHHTCIKFRKTTTMADETFKEQSTEHWIFEDGMKGQDDDDDFVQNIVAANLADPANQGGQYACYKYDADDWKAMGTNPSVAKQKWRCENDLGYLFSKGDRQKAPGCGSCWCCRPTGHCDRIADIGLLVDYSLSVKYHTAEEKEFVKRLVAKFNLGRERTRASVITFSTYSVMKIKLNQFYDKALFDRAVDNMDMTKHDTRMDLALHKARSDMFQSSSGARVRVPKTLILLTDGIQDPPAQYNEEPRIPAEILRKDGITILAVGVGSTNQRKLEEITGNPNNVYHISNFQQLISKEFIDKIGTKTCESGPKYTCYHWTSADKSKMGPQPWSTETMKRHCEKTLGHTFTGGNDLKAPGCGGCLCCKALGPWSCHHWTSEDIAKIGPARKLADETRRCEKDLGFRFTAGDNNKAPGCGTCWCCKKNEYKCYHWTSTDKAKIESMHGKWCEANQRERCEKTLGFKFTKGNEKNAPGCGNCWCCQPKVQ